MSKLIFASNDYRFPLCAMYMLYLLIANYVLTIYTALRKNCLLLSNKNSTSLYPCVKTGFLWAKKYFSVINKSNYYSSTR